MQHPENKISRIFFSFTTCGVWKILKNKTRTNQPTNQPTNKQGQNKQNLTNIDNTAKKKKKKYLKQHYTSIGAGKQQYYS